MRKVVLKEMTCRTLNSFLQTFLQRIEKNKLYKYTEF